MRYRPITILLAISLACVGVAPAGEFGPEPLPAYHIPLRVHLAESSRPGSEFPPVFAEINAIWFKQAGICFEIEAVRHEQEPEEGLSMWFHPEIGGWNGSYDGEQILMKDHPILAPAPHPARESAARTAAHELGHALGLPHDQGDSDNLMASKTYGWRLNPEEVAGARQAAAHLARPVSGGKACSAPRFEP